jgi:hypothetical protein
MIEIVTALGPVRINKETRKHCEQNHHRNPENNEELQQAIASGSYRVTDAYESKWKQRKASNYVLLVHTAKRFFVVLLKQMEGSLLMVTAFLTNPWRAGRMTRSAEALEANPT